MIKTYRLEPTGMLLPLVVGQFGPMVCNGDACVRMHED